MSEYSGESGRRASADRIIDEIYAVLERNGIYPDEDTDHRTLKWDDPDDRAMVREKFDGDASSDEAILPAFGEQGRGRNARGDCGNPHPFLCDSCGHAVDFGRTCGQSVCARCGVAWMRDSAIKKAAKIRRVRKEKDWNTADSEHQKIHHQIISPSLGWFFDLASAGYSLEEAQKKTKEIVKTILDELRAQGVLARHSYRGVNDDGSIKSESDDRGTWKELLNSGRDFYGDVRDQLGWKPHYHAVVVADWLELKGDGDEPGLAERVEEATGWVLHRIENDDGVSVANDGAMARLASYTVSHTDIQVREHHNRSALWEVGSFEGDAIKSSPRFSATPSDLEWADSVVRRVAHKTLGIKSGTTDCGVDLPGVDEPDELARRIIESLYPDADRDDVEADAVLDHVAAGNIVVDVSSTSGGGGEVDVQSAWGQPIGPDGWGGDLPQPKGDVVDGAEVAPLAERDQEPPESDCSCGDDHGSDDDRDGADECDGTLIPLEEARQRGLLDDNEWVRDAPHVDEAREVDDEWPDELEPFRTSPPGKAIGAG